MRMLGCAAIVGSSVMAIEIPLARGQAERALRATGITLLSQLGPGLVGPPQLVELNGERMWLASTVSPHDVARVLSEFERHCERFLTSSSVSQDGVGYLACLSRSAERDPRSLVARVREFTLTGDLSRLGDARYVVAKPDLASGKTHVLSMWTEGRFNLSAMFPDSSDVPGGDSEDVPRPPDSVRILSARMNERPYAVHMYASRKTSAEVLDYYARELGRQGFSGIEAPSAADAHAFVRDGSGVIVTASSTSNGGACVSLLELGSRGYVGAQMKEAP